MRLIFIPGFGEEPSIFDKIHPQLPGEKVFVDNWAIVGDTPRPELNALVYARELVEKFSISAKDVVIGHSMGGWIGYHMKHLTGCHLIQIASWTSRRKVVSKAPNTKTGYWPIRRGLVFNPLVKQYFLWKNYRHKPSYPIFDEVFTNLIRRNKENVINQLRIIQQPVSETITAEPDLRIHARADSIIRFPRQPVVEVPGDHFTLYTHPEKVYTPILALLRQEKVVEP